MSKQKKIGWIIMVLFLAALSLLYLARSSEREDTAQAGVYDLTMLDTGFDTPVTFQAWGTEEEFVTWLDLLRNRFIKNNALFDQYEDDPETIGVYDLNQAEPGESVRVSSIIMECLSVAEKANALFDKFDVTQGKLISLWHDFREGTIPLPDDAQVQALIHATGSEAILVDSENGLLTKNDDFWFDFGAIAKGFTVEQAAAELKGAGCKAGYINAGGNVQLIGNKPDGEPWKVGIIQPDSDRSLIVYTTEEPTSLVTSGDYQRYVEKDGVRYSHIIDPSTGYPATGVRSVTVFNPSSAWADAMSTSLFLMSLEEGMEFCRENGLEACWILDEGTSGLEPDFSDRGFDVYCTSGILPRLSLSQS